MMENLCSKNGVVKIHDHDLQIKWFLERSRKRNSSSLCCLFTKENQAAKMKGYLNYQRGPDSLLKFEFLDFCYSKVPIFLQKSLSNWPVTLRKIIFFSSKYRVSQKIFYLGHPVLFWKIFRLIQLHYNKKCYWHNWKKILAAGCPTKKLFLTEYW